MATGRQPWADRGDSGDLAIDIIGGERPPVFEGMPKAYSMLMKRCWCPLPEKRPTAKELYVEAGVLWSQYLKGYGTFGEVGQQFQKADDVWSRAFVDEALEKESRKST